MFIGDDMRKQKTAIPQDIRERVLRRDGYRCRYCGSLDGPFQMDHVYPESKGGETSVNNLVTACRKCNNKKHAQVGMWPKPVGYWDEDVQQKRAHRMITSKKLNSARVNAVNRYVDKTRQRFSFVKRMFYVTALVVMVSSVLMTFHDFGVIDFPIITKIYSLGGVVEILLFGFLIGVMLVLRKVKYA